jgi:CHASE2 domain-containing sensor protein
VKGPSPGANGRRRAARSIAAVAVTLAFSILLERENGPGDLAFSLQARTSSPTAPAAVKVVRIDTADYRRIFGATSPLNRDRVTEIIRAIAAHRPLVIGIDIESVDPWYATFPERINGVPLVWSRKFSCQGNASMTAACPADERIPVPAAGRPTPDSLRAGIIMLPLEQDGSFRRYTRFSRTRDGIHPAFSTVLLLRAGRAVEPESPDASRFIRFRRSSKADSAYTAQWVLGRGAASGSPSHVFRNKIVLLGGTYGQERNHYPTPLGDLAGVEVVAQIVETELEGGGQRTPPAWRFFIIQCLAGFGIVMVFHRRDLKSAFRISVVLALVAAPVISWLVFGTWRLWFYFLPVLSVWLIQQLYDEAMSYRDKLLLGEGLAPSSVSPVGMSDPVPSAADRVSVPTQPSRKRSKGRNRRR